MWQTLDGSIHLWMKCVNSVIAYTMLTLWFGGSNPGYMLPLWQWENKLSVNVFA